MGSPFVPPIDTGVVRGTPFTGLDGHQYASVQIDSTGLTVIAALIYTSAPGGYASGVRVTVQVMPIGSKVGAVVYGVLM